MIGAYDEMQQEKEKCKGLEEKYQENTREKNKEEKTYEKISSELAANENKKAKSELPEKQKEFDAVREEKETISEVHLDLKKKAEEMNNKLREIWAKERTFGDQFKSAKNLVNQKKRNSKV